MSLFGNQSVWLVIVCSALSCRSRDWCTSLFKIYKNYMFITMCYLTNSSYVYPTPMEPNPLEWKSPECQYNMSVRPSGHPQDFCYFCIFIYFHCGVQCCDAFIPTLGSKQPQLGPVKLMCLSVYLSIYLSASLYISLSLCLFYHVALGWSNCAARNFFSTCGRRPPVQIPWVAV